MYTPEQVERLASLASNSFVPFARDMADALTAYATTLRQNPERGVTEADEPIGHPRSETDKRDEIELFLRDAYAAGCHAARAVSPMLAITYAHREAPKLRAALSAQGQGDEREYMARDFYEDAKAGRVPWPGDTAPPAQPAAPLFYVQGRPVHRGDVLHHPDTYATGKVVTAEFRAKGDMVTVRTANGAVPTVRVSELSWPDAQPAERVPEGMAFARDAIEDAVEKALDAADVPVLYQLAIMNGIAERLWVPETAKRNVADALAATPAAPADGDGKEGVR